VSTNKTPRQQNIMRYASLATQWMVMMLLAVWQGIKADKLLQWKIPVFVVALPVLALGVSMWQLIKDVSRPRP
jgi:hypothetical protein